jgi:hypothetical protein
MNLERWPRGCVEDLGGTPLEGKPGTAVQQAAGLDQPRPQRRALTSDLVAHEASLLLTRTTNASYKRLIGRSDAARSRATTSSSGGRAHAVKQVTGYPTDVGDRRTSVERIDGVAAAWANGLPDQPAVCGQSHPEVEIEPAAMRHLTP